MPFPLLAAAAIGSTLLAGLSDATGGGGGGGGSGGGSGGKKAVIERPWIHYDAVLKPALAKLTDLLNEYIAKGVPRQQADRLIRDTVQKSTSESEKRALEFGEAYIASGQQVLVVGPVLQEMFVETSLEKVPRDALLLPYDCYYIALPNCPWRMLSRMHGWTCLRGIYVMKHDDHTWRILLEGPIVGSPDHSAVNEAYLFIDLDEVYPSSGPGDLEGYYVEKLGEAIRKRMQQLEPEGLAEIMQTQINALRVVVNSALYWNSGGKEIVADSEYAKNLADLRRLEAEKKKILASSLRERSKRREIDRIEDKAGRLSGATVVFVGPSIESRDLGEAPGEEMTSTGRRSMRRHWVRGHWRMPARKSGERLLVWVQPFQRGGSQKGEVTSRTYIMEPPPGGAPKGTTDRGTEEEDGGEPFHGSWA